MKLPIFTLNDKYSDCNLNDFDVVSLEHYINKWTVSFLISQMAFQANSANSSLKRAAVAGVPQTIFHLRDYNNGLGIKIPG